MRFFRALLHLYPAAFRQEYGSEMTAVFARQRRDASGAGALAALWLAALTDALCGAIAVHWEILRRDLRQAARSLRRSPGFALTVVPVMVLGIGANTAAFSIADYVLLRPLPYPHAERLVRISEAVPGYARLEPSPANYRDWHRLATCFSSMGAATTMALNLVGQGEPQRVEVSPATADLFPTLGVKPLLGRFFTAAEDRDGAAGTLLLSYALWQGAFAGDPHVLGRRLLLDGEPFEVIGVMPAEFSYPDRDVQLWLPMRFSPPAFADRNNFYLEVVARLRPGVSLARAQAQMALVAAQINRQYAHQNDDAGTLVEGLRDNISDGARLLLVALCGAALCVLLIACANIANLQLARALTRQHELDVRAALGAGRNQLARQLATESLALALLGGVLAVAAAHAALPLLSRLVPAVLPVAESPSIDWRVLLFAAVITGAIGFAVGMIPAWRAGRAHASNGAKGGNGASGDSFTGLRQGSRSGGGRLGRLRGALVAAEVTFSVVLLVSAGLLLRALWRVQGTDLGYRPEGVVTLRTELPMPAYGGVARRTAFYSHVLDVARRLPGVTGAGYTTAVPVVLRGGIWPVTIAGRPADTANDQSSLRYVTPEYFATMGIALLLGRDVRDSDTATAPYVAVVSASFARRYWPHQDPIGRRFQFALHDRMVAGVVGDVRVRGRERVSEPQVYVPYRQVADNELLYYAPKDLVVRATGDPLALLPLLRRAVRDADPQQSIASPRLLGEVIAEDTAPRAVQLRVLAAFAAVALLLAGVGIYGLLAFAVSQRSTEIGVRMALGAGVRDILTLVAGRGALLALAGVVPGLLLAYAAARAMAAILAGVQPTDGATYLIVVILCLIITAAGSILPAQRAARIDPATVIRQQ